MINIKYDLVYADPPWQYNNCNRQGLNGLVPYKQMKTDDICKLEIKNEFNDNCILFIWCTFPKIREGLKVIKAWGFNYKTIGFLWVKTCSNGFIKSVGFYTRSNAEPCLLAVKGSGFSKIIEDKSVSQIVLEPRKGHSEKPLSVKYRISRMYPNLKKIELFARNQYINYNWDYYGDELSSTIQKYLEDK